MRKKSIFILLGLVFSVTSLAITDKEFSSYDLAPGVIPGAGASAQSDEQWDLQYEYMAETQSGDNGCLGIAFDGTYIWVSGRGAAPNPNMIYLFDPITGVLVDQFPSGSASSWGCRDLCFDETYMYGGWEEGMIQWDINTHAVITTIPFPAGMQFQRANAYDPVTDHFYTGNFGNTCYEQDRSGNLIRSWSPAPLTAVYGMAWDDDDPAGPYLWVYDQGVPDCYAYQFDPVTLTYTGVVSGSLRSPSIYPYALAGGLDYCRGIDPQYSSMLSFAQSTPDAGGAWEMYYVGGQPDLTVTLTPYGTPITIPQWGGEFEFNILLENNGVNPETLDTWTMTTLPNGRVVGPLMGPVNLILLPGGTPERDRTQTVPANAPGGNYYYRAYVGTYPDVVWDLNGFIFSKMLTPGDFKILGWENRGEIFANEQLNIALGPQSDSKLSFAHPNPFNQSVTIAYEIPQAGKVSLKVYDISGREVAMLVEGNVSAGSHILTWNADGLASGVYFCILNNKRHTEIKKIILLK